MKNFKMLGVTFLSVLALQACDDDDDINVTVTPPAPAPTPAPTTIVDVAVADGNFTTLVAALQATGLDATLADASGEFTVFAPTDAAFAMLGDDTINALLADTDTLTDILTYHVYSGEVDAASAIGLAGTTVEMVNGDSVGLSLDGDSLLVNTSTVTMTDIETDNGIIHVIDAVLMPPADKGEPMMNIVETAVAAGNFTTLVAALQATNLDAALADEDGMFTVFAPTDAAFAAINGGTIGALLENPDTLANILLQHVVNAEVPSVNAYALNGMSAETMSGAMLPIAINSMNDMLSIAGINIVAKDIYTSNGVIHVIDTVIIGDAALPAASGSIVDVAVGSGAFNTLVAALQATNLDSVLAGDGAFTVFAPTDEAFALLGEDTINALLADPDALANILLYHVVPGAAVLQDAAVGIAQSDMQMVTMANEQVATISRNDSNLYVNKSQVSSANILATNGVIHVIDQVILPPAMMDEEPTMSIVDVAVGNPNFSTLVAALTAADLVTTLADESATFTVFAPTDAAFAKIESGALSDIIADVPTLTSILLKHVVSGAEIDSLTAYTALGSMVETAGGDKIGVELVNFTQTTNDETDEVAYNAMYQALVGGMNSDMAGYTLYVFDNDLGTGTSACVDTCAANWPPVLVTDGEVDNIPGLSTITRGDGTMQAAYQGRPLYFFVGDMQAGDMNGQGLNDVWWVAKQEQVSLQIQGSNVTTTDIYTTNGVIHVIDTVITE